MKKLLYAIIACCFSLYSCENHEECIELLNNDTNEQTILVGVNFSGEIDTQENLLTRSDTESNDLIGIQVYKDGERFCYGIFDSFNDVHVDLKAGATYKFACTMVKDGKLICKPYARGQTYGDPFNVGTTYVTGSNDCDNRIHYSTGLFMTGISGSSTGGYFTEADRFYGEISGYVPSVNGTVTIPLRRVSCGIKVKVSGVTDGSVNVNCYNYRRTIYENKNVTSFAESVGKMYCMESVLDAWKYADNEYQEAINLSVVWTRGNGIVQDFGTKTAYVKRNAMNIIDIKLSTNDTDVDIDVDPEEGDMGEEDEDLSN